MDSATVTVASAEHSISACFAVACRTVSPGWSDAIGPARRNRRRDAAPGTSALIATSAIRQSISRRTVSPSPRQDGTASLPRRSARGSVDSTLARASSPRSASRWLSSRAPASTSIRIASQIAMSPSSSASTRMLTTDPVSRRNSTPRRGVDQDHVPLVPRISSRSPSHPDPRRRRGGDQTQGLRRERAQREVDRLPLGTQLVAAHDRSTGLVVDIDIGACYTHLEGPWLKRSRSLRSGLGGARLPRV